MEVRTSNKWVKFSAETPSGCSENGKQLQGILFFTAPCSTYETNTQRTTHGHTENLHIVLNNKQQRTSQYPTHSTQPQLERRDMTDSTHNTIPTHSTHLQLGRTDMTKTVHTCVYASCAGESLLVSPGGWCPTALLCSL